jgi:multidrug resistance efflux pump
MTKTKLLIYVAVILAMVFGSTACNGAAISGSGAEPTALPTVKADTRVTAEGKLVPRKDVQLAFVTGGEVAEVLVKVGDQVKIGDVLARLDNREQLQANIANTEMEVLNAKQARDKLDDLADISRTETLARIASTTAAVRDAKYMLDNFTVPTEQKDMDPFDAATVMRQRLYDAQAAFDKVKDRSLGDPTRKDLKEKLDDAQSAYNSAVRRLEYVIQLQTAEMNLARAEKDYRDVKDGPKADDIEAADERIKAAEAALKSAQAAFDNLELLSTINGTVVDVDLIVGEQVNPGAPVISIADFSQWYVETDDLTEIDVVKISTGQKVEVVADALPDQTLAGTVDSIKDISEEKRGDVTYTVRILLDQVDPHLRWGMTVIVTFAE